MGTSKKGRKLTTEERLDRLVERHEALTQTVEILAGMQTKTERDIDRFIIFAQAIIERTDKRLTKLEKGRA
jgi:hypothetical protein